MLAGARRDTCAEMRVQTAAGRHYVFTAPRRRALELARGWMGY